MIDTNPLKNNECVLSINTTGINRHKNKIFLVNLLFGDKDEITQVFLDENNPKHSLEKISSLLKNYTLISYNGDSFDIPFLNEFFRKNGLEVLTNSTFDILKFLKKYNFLSLENYKLKYIYENFTRKEFSILEQKETIKIYKNYLKNNEQNLQDKLFEQGRLSLLCRFEIYSIMQDIIKKSSIDFNIYGLNYKVSPYNYSISDNFLNISLINTLSEFYELNILNDYFKITTKDNFLNIRYRLINGLISENTKAVCVVYPDNFNIASRFNLINNELIPIYYNDKLDLPLIINILKDSLINLK